MRRDDWTYPRPAFPEIRGGRGALEALAGWLDDLGVKRVVIITSPAVCAEQRLLQRVSDELGPRLAGVFGEVRPHAPMDRVHAALDVVREHEADAVVSLGGGSSVDTAKGVVWYLDPDGDRRPLTHIAIPSTFSGAEYTTDAGLTDDDDGKRVHRHERIIPRLVLLDPAVPATAPRSLLAGSLVNALAHCLEGYVSVGGSPMSEAFYVHGIRRLREAAQTLHTPQGLAAAQEGSSLAALHQVPMGLAHALVHVVGGRHRTPHGATHGVVAPAVMRLNLPHVAERQAVIGEALGARRSGSAQERAWATVEAVRALTRALDLPSSLRELGVPHEDLPRIAEEASHDASFATNPVPLDDSDVRTCLEWAWSGEVPSP